MLISPELVAAGRDARRRRSGSATSTCRRPATATARTTWASPSSRRSACRTASTRRRSRWALSAPSPGSIIVYTTNGSTPTVNASLVPTNGTLYTGPINVSATTTLRAVAFKADYKPSFVAAQHVHLSERRDQPVAAGADAARLARQRRRQRPGDELRDRPRHHRPLRRPGGEGLARVAAVDLDHDRSGEPVQLQRRASTSTPATTAAIGNAPRRSS